MHARVMSGESACPMLSIARSSCQGTAGQLPASSGEIEAQEEKLSSRQVGVTIPSGDLLMARSLDYCCAALPDLFDWAPTRLAEHIT